MKKIISITIVLIIFVVGGIIFGIKNFSSSKVNDRDFIVIKGYGENLYHYSITMPKGTKAKEIITGLEDVLKEPSKIYIKKGASWKVANENDKIFRDSTFKAEF